jgi:hypothetical protein
MENPEPINASLQGTGAPTSKSGTHRWMGIAGVSLAILLIAAESFQAWQIFGLTKQVSGLQWSDALHERDDDSVLSTDVGTIQFMKKGYTGKRLYLHGVVGNPTQVSISDLALKFTATKQLYQYEDDYDKDPFIMYGLPPIGEAQTSPIPYLAPGKAESFDVTIPNVKQTKDGFRLVVAFGGGERYAYY